MIGFLRHLYWVSVLASGQLMLVLGNAAADAASLVSLQAIEGIPYEDAREIEASEVDLLVAVLADPSREVDHSRALRLLGISAHPGAFEALTAYASSPPVGAVSSASFNAQIAVRHAFGHLAHRDDRALRWLLAEVAQPATPEWSYVSYRGPPLARLLHRATLRGLALSGRAEGAAVLQDPGLGSDDSELLRAAASLRETHARVAAMGPERALSGSKR